jgi:hypothetical protein
MSPHPIARPVAVLAILLVSVVAAATARGQVRQRVVERRVGERTLTGIDGLRALHKSGKPADAERYAYSLLWKDIRQPEVLYLLASTEDRLKKRQEAAVYYALFLRTLDEAGDAAPPEVAKFRRIAEQRLKGDRQDKPSLSAAYAKTAAGKKFESPDKVDDVWMNNVQGDLFSLHALYAWKLVGGRKDAKADWVHNTQGAPHRSGLKYVDEVEGRKGVLFTVPLKDMNSQDADASNREGLEKLGHNSHIEARNVGGGKFVRAGLRGYGFPVLVKVLVDGKELASETVGTDQWTDLKVELPPAEARDAAEPSKAQAPAGNTALFNNETGQRVVMELIVPEGQQWSEGVWIDYFDFYDN